MSNMNKLMVDVKVGETLYVGQSAIKLTQKSGQVARLEVTANPETEIRVPKHIARMSVLQNNGVQHG